MKTRKLKKEWKLLLDILVLGVGGLVVGATIATAFVLWCMATPY